jgi:hypothetical protein
MTPQIHTLILEGQETFLLYKAIVETRQYKEIEYEDTKDYGSR